MPKMSATKPSAFYCLAGLLLLCYASGCYGNSCYPVMEGNSCTLTCTGAITDRTIMWEKSVDNDKNLSLSTCSLANGDCNKFSDYDINITTTGGGNFTSHLTIGNVQSSDRGVTFRCLSHDTSTHRLLLLQEFEMSQVYFPPQNVQCSAEVTTTSVVKVSCKTDKVYPDAVCELQSSVWNGTKLTTKDTTFKYTQTPLSGNSYNCTTCTTSVNIHQPGAYNFTVGMFVKDNNIPGLKESAAVFQTSTVTVDPFSFSLNVPPNVHVCNNEPVYLNCTADWFPFNFDLVCRLPNNISKRKAKTIGSGYYGLNFTYRYLPQRNEREEVVKCDIYSPNGTTVRSLERTMTISWPPLRPPMFNYQGMNIQWNSEIQVAEGEKAHLFCLVEGGNPPVSSLQVQCRSSDQSVTLLDQHWNSDTGAFTLEASEHLDKSSCVCSAYHDTNCYNLTATVTIFVDLQEKSSSQTSESAGTYTSPACIILYVLLTVGAAICTAGVVGIYLSCRHTCKMYRQLPNPTSYPYDASSPDRRDLPV